MALGLGQLDARTFWLKQSNLVENSQKCCSSKKGQTAMRQFCWVQLKGLPCVEAWARLPSGPGVEEIERSVMCCVVELLGETDVTALSAFFLSETDSNARIPGRVGTLKSQEGCTICTGRGLK